MGRAINDKRKYELIKLRRAYGFTQQQVADMLEVNLKTIQRSEKDEELNVKYISRLTVIENDITKALEALDKIKLNGNEDTTKLLRNNKLEDIKNKQFLIKHLTNSGGAKSGVTQFNYERLKALIATFVKQASDFNPGTTRIAKLVYSLDEIWLNETLRTYTGATYIKMGNGPVLDQIYMILNDMVNEKYLEIKITDDGHTVYRSGTKEFIEFENENINKLLKISTKELINNSHKNEAWIKAEDFETIII